MTKNPAVSLRAQWLAEKLRTARHRSGYTMREAAEYLQTDHTTLGRFERGTHRIRRAYVKDLLDFYGVANERERNFLLQIAEDTWRKDWSDMDDVGLEAEFIDYTWLESKAVKIQVFEPLIIHGLLQTPQYVEGMYKVKAGSATAASDLAHIVDVRNKRQTIIHSEHPPHLTIIMEEPALHRPIGGREMFRNQLSHILDMTTNDHIVVRVLSNDAPTDPGHQGPFTIFTMPDPYPTIAYVENVAGWNFYENEDKVNRFRQTYDEVQALALSPTESARLIENTLKDLK